MFSFVLTFPFLIYFASVSSLDGLYQPFRREEQGAAAEWQARLAKPRCRKACDEVTFTSIADLVPKHQLREPRCHKLSVADMRLFAVYLSSHGDVSMGARSIGCAEPRRQLRKPSNESAGSITMNKPMLSFPSLLYEKSKVKYNSILTASKRKGRLV